MDLAVYGLACVVIAVSSAYTRTVQKATLYWGKVLSPNSPLLPRGLQDAITPPMQTVRNLLNMIFYLMILVVGLTYFHWYWAIGAFVATFLLDAFIAVVMMPSPNSLIFFNQILRSLADRRAKYQAASDQLRVEAIDEILLKLKQLRPEHFGLDPKRFGPDW